MFNVNSISSDRGGIVRIYGGLPGDMQDRHLHDRFGPEGASYYINAEGYDPVCLTDVGKRAGANPALPLAVQINNSNHYWYYAGEGQLGVFFANGMVDLSGGSLTRLFLSASGTKPSDDYSSKFSQLWSDDPKAFAANTQHVLDNAGIPPIDLWAPHLTQNNAKRKDSSDSRVDVHWWGVDFVMSGRLTTEFTSAITVPSTFASMWAGHLIASGIAGTIVGCPPAAAIGGMIGLAIAAKIGQIKLTDNGNGVHWPVSWLQWAALAWTAAAPPAAFLLLQPFPN